MPTASEMIKAYETRRAKKLAANCGSRNQAVFQPDYYQALGELIEQHPSTSPRGGYGISLQTIED